MSTNSKDYYFNPNTKMVLSDEPPMYIPQNIPPSVEQLVRSMFNDKTSFLIRQNHYLSLKNIRDYLNGQLDTFDKATYFAGNSGQRDSRKQTKA